MCVCVMPERRENPTVGSECEFIFCTLAAGAQLTLAFFCKVDGRTDLPRSLPRSYPQPMLAVSKTKKLLAVSHSWHDKQMGSSWYRPSMEGKRYQLARDPFVVKGNRY